MSNDSAEYFQRRERAERAAAKHAACPEARRVHQELAQNYAALGQRPTALNAAGEQPTRNRLTIVTR